MRVFQQIPDEVRAFTGLIDTYIRWKEYQGKDDRQYYKYHPSEWGMCLRKQQYKHYQQLGYFPVEWKGHKSTLLRLFDKGHNMHERWSRYFEACGVLRGVWTCQNKMCKCFDDEGFFDLTKITETKSTDHSNANGKGRVYGEEELKGVFRPERCVCGCTDFKYDEVAVDHEGTNIYGHADLILDFENFKPEMFKGVSKTFKKEFFPKKGEVVVGDMKTCSDNVWKSKVMKNQPHSYYLIQLTVYAHILECDYGLLMYENKNNSELKMFRVDRNEKWWAIIQEQAHSMIEMKKKKLLPPPRPDNKSSFECKNCEFKDMCHKSRAWGLPNIDEIRKGWYKEIL